MEGEGRKNGQNEYKPNGTIDLFSFQSDIFYNILALIFIRKKLDRTILLFQIYQLENRNFFSLLNKTGTWLLLHPPCLWLPLNALQHAKSKKKKGFEMNTIRENWEEGKKYTSAVRFPAGPLSTPRESSFLCCSACIPASSSTPASNLDSNSLSLSSSTNT